MSAKRVTVVLSTDEVALLKRVSADHGGLPLSRVVAAAIFGLAEMPTARAGRTILASLERSAEVVSVAEKYPRGGVLRQLALRELKKIRAKR